jgi:hypothetical protein
LLLMIKFVDHLQSENRPLVLKHIIRVGEFGDHSLLHFLFYVREAEAIQQVAE